MRTTVASFADELEVDLDATAVEKRLLLGDESARFAFDEAVAFERGQIILGGSERIGIVGQTHNDGEESVFLTDGAPLSQSFTLPGGIAIGQSMGKPSASTGTGDGSGSPLHAAAAKATNNKTETRCARRFIG